MLYKGATPYLVTIIPYLVIGGFTPYLRTGFASNLSTLIIFIPSMATSKPPNISISSSSDNSAFCLSSLSTKIASYTQFKIKLANSSHSRLCKTNKKYVVMYNVIIYFY